MPNKESNSTFSVYLEVSKHQPATNAAGTLQKYVGLFFDWMSFLGVRDSF